MSKEVLDLQFDLYQRYRRTQDIVSRVRKGERFKILDVGGGEDFISRFFPEDETFILDTHSSSLKNYVQGDARDMKFEDNSFDIVTSLDVYEHLPNKDRFLLVKECNRVAKRLAIIAAPFGTEETLLAEDIIRTYCKDVLGKENLYLAEHLKMGLPQISELEEYLKKESIRHVRLPSSYIYNWVWMMLISERMVSLPDPEEIHAQVSRYYNTHFYEQDNRQPCYRYFYVLGSGSDLDAVKEDPVTCTEEEKATRLLGAQLFMQSSALQSSITKMVSRLEKHVENFQAMVKEKDENIVGLQVIVKEKDEIIAELQQSLAAIKASTIGKVLLYWAKKRHKGAENKTN